MKTIKKEYKVYTFDELSQESKDKAREEYNEDNDFPFLQDDLREYMQSEESFREACEANGYTFLSTGEMFNN